MKSTRALISGFAATVAMTALMIVAPMMGMPKMDFGAMLGTGNPMMPLPYWTGPGSLRTSLAREPRSSTQGCRVGVSADSAK